MFERLGLEKFIFPLYESVHWNRYVAFLSISNLLYFSSIKILLVYQKSVL